MIFKYPLIQASLTPGQWQENLDLGVCPEDQNDWHSDSDALSQHQEEGHQKKVLQ